MEASTASFVVLLLMNIAGHHQSSSVKTASNGRLQLHYQLTEGQPNGTLVSNVARDAG